MEIAAHGGMLVGADVRAAYLCGGPRADLLVLWRWGRVELPVQGA